MIDTHCHLLPMCDDGPAEWQTCMEMAGNAAAQGVRTIIATPHHRRAPYDNPPEKIREIVGRFNQMAEKENLAVTVLEGQEFHWEGNAPWHRAVEGLQTLGSTGYALLELPHRRTPASFREDLAAFRARGLHVVIAHPERHLPFVQDPLKLYSFLREGAYAQLTASSLTGHHGKAVQEAAWTMARNGWVHLLASDAHNLGSRPNRLEAAYALAAGELGDRLPELWMRNAERLVRDEELRREEFVTRKTGVRWWNIRIP
ncbi:tyrosine-protein phosphatase [Cohnella cellulosilytica]|uniref:Tyrosine-protein phosphatase n=1 Tax=Cohnella cellulosilytica TaxID=986710 RepID=A0ABW2FNF9_9BACL